MLSGKGNSTARREGIVVSVSILLTDFSVDPMHQDFALLVLGNFASGLHRRFLRGMV